MVQRVLRPCVALVFYMFSVACGASQKPGSTTSATQARGDAAKTEAETTLSVDGGAGESVAMGEAEQGDATPKQTIEAPQAKPLDDRAVALAKEARERLQAGDLRNAESRAREALKQDARIGAAYAVLGDLRVRQGQERAAAGFFARALELTPDLAEALASLCAVEHRAGDARAALRHSTAALEVAPRSVGVRLVHARNLVALDKPDEAWSVARGVLKIEERNATAYAVLAEAALAQDRVQLAEEVIERGLTIEEGHSGLLLLRARLQQADGQLAEAVRTLKLASERNVEDVAAQLAYGRVLLEAGNYDEAKRVLAAAAARVPTAFELRLALAEAHRMTRQWDVALREYDWLRRKAPKAPEIQFNLGLLYMVGLEKVPGMDRLRALQAAKSAFLRYRDLSGRDGNRKAEALAVYLRDVERQIGREQKRAARAARAAQQEESDS